MKKSKILSLILCVMLVIAFASLDASAATDVQTKKVLGNSLYDGSVDLVEGVDKFVATVTDKGTVRTATTVTGASENDAEKAADDEYYKIYADQSGNYVVLEVLPQLSALNSDAFISFDFKLDDNSTINLFCVNNLYDSENKKYTTNYPQTQLGYISNKGGFYETGAQTILGKYNDKQETFVTADKFRAGKWNSVQIAICGKDNTFKMRVNGVEYNIPTQKTYTLSDKTYSLENGFYGISLKLNMTAGATAYLDNMYMQTGMDGAPLLSDEKFNEDHGHLGFIEEHSISTAYLINNVENGIVNNGKLIHTEKNQRTEYTDNADITHFYVKPGTTVQQVIDSITLVEGSAHELKFYADAAMTTQITDDDIIPDEGVAKLPLFDGGENKTHRSYVEYYICAGPFEFGMGRMNSAANTFYGVIGFNPTIDDPAALYGGDEKPALVIPDSFGGINVSCIGDYAFYKGAPAFTTEVSYPNINFDLSKVKSSGKCWTGERAFKKTGIEKVEFKASSAWMQDHAYEECQKLTVVDLTNCQGGQSNIFRNCDSLTTVNASNLNIWNWGGTTTPFIDCDNLDTASFGYSKFKAYIDPAILTSASGLKKITLNDAPSENTSAAYLANTLTLYAAAYDGDKMVGVSVLKKVNESDDFKTLTIPQVGTSVKIFQLDAAGKLIPVTNGNTALTITIK